MKIAPSVLSANFLKLQEEIERINVSGADFLHIDVMDGHFVPNLTFGPSIVKQIAQISTLPLDIHLMVERVPFFVDLFLPLRPRFLGVHLEAEKHLHRIVSHIRAHQVSPCIVLNPHTSLEGLRYLLPEIDMVLLMSVNPGFGGQKFIPHTLEKISHLKEMIERYNPQCLIEVDGGVNAENASSLFQAGADILVAGSYVFGAEDYTQAILSLKS